MDITDSNIGSNVDVEMSARESVQLLKTSTSTLSLNMEYPDTVFAWFSLRSVLLVDPFYDGTKTHSLL